MCSRYIPEIYQDLHLIYIKQIITSISQAPWQTDEQTNFFTFDELSVKVSAQTTIQFPVVCASAGVIILD
jgi:hypothetical protein